MIRYQATRESSLQHLECSRRGACKSSCHLHPLCCFSFFSLTLLLYDDTSYTSSTTYHSPEILILHVSALSFRSPLLSFFCLRLYSFFVARLSRTYSHTAVVAGCSRHRRRGSTRGGKTATTKQACSVDEVARFLCSTAAGCDCVVAIPYDCLSTVDRPH